MIFAKILDIICTFNEAFWIFYYAYLLLGRKRRQSVILGIVGILGDIIIVFGMNQMILVSPYTGIISMLFVIIMICIGWAVDFLTSVALVGPYYFFLMLKGTLEISLTGWIGGEYWLEQLFEKQGWQRCIYLCISGGLWFGINYFISKQLEKRNFSKKKNFFAAFSFLGIVGTTFFVGQMLKTFNVDTNMAMYGFLIVFSGAIFGFYYRSKCIELEREHKLAEKQSMVMEEKYEGLKKYYLENAKLYHDMNHHLGAIYQVAKSENVTGIIEYIQDMKRKPILSEMTVWTGIDIIDTILSEKLAQAKEKGIKVELKVQMLPVDMQISNRELCSLFGNLLSNCIEANPTYIKILIKQIGEMLLIQTRNDFFGKRRKENNRYLTSKKDADRHGFGMQNMEDVIKNHNGSIECRVEDDVFCVDILMNLFDATK